MPWIVGAISRANKAHSSDGVRRPEGVTNKIADVRRAKAKLADAAGFVRSEDVARELGITMAELSELEWRANGVFPVSDATPRVGSVGEDESVAVVDDEAEQDEIDGREDVRKLLAVLTPSERDVIESKFGLGVAPQAHSLDDVRRGQGVSYKSVAKLYASALAKLRAA
jgi:DNA-directed RNA polymerase sigma subunit (sigma70/sigma32)